MDYAHHNNFSGQVKALHEEPRLVSLEVRLVKGARRQGYQRRVYRSMQGRLFILWDEYMEGGRSPQQLLRTCGRLDTINLDR